MTAMARGRLSIIMGRYLLAACLLPWARPDLPAQEPSSQDIPDEVYYLMPSFGQGMIYFRGQGPAQGQLNICAVDNTLRYIDDDGTELAAASVDNILKVRIDTVTFIRHQDSFVRLYPVSDDAGIAVRRDVRILKDARQGAFGTTSQTSSIKEYGTLYTEGVAVALNQNRKYPYKVSETFFIYKDDSVLLPTRNNLRKLFPAKKEEIEAYFKSNRSFPDDIGDASALIALWAR
jgi:hypothetical protein